MQDQNTSPEEHPVMEPYTSRPAANEVPTPPKTRITLTRMESFVVIEKLKALPNIATTSMEDIVTYVRTETEIVTTPAIIRNMLKDMGVPHVTFRSTPKQSAVLNEEFLAKIDGLNSRLEFVTKVVSELSTRVNRLEETLALTEKRMLDQGQKIASVSIDVQKIDRELEAASR